MPRLLKLFCVSHLKPAIDTQRCSRPMLTIHAFNRDLPCAGKGRGRVERKRYVNISPACAYSQTRGMKYTSLKSQESSRGRRRHPSQLFGFWPVVSICDLHCRVQRVVGRIACDRICEGTLYTIKCSAGFQYLLKKDIYVFGCIVASLWHVRSFIAVHGL